MRPQKDDIVVTYLKKQVDELVKRLNEVDPGGKEVTWENIQNKPEVFPPSVHEHKANEVFFEDGNTFQDKLDDGSLKGQDGKTPQMMIDENGHLIAIY